MVLKGPLCTPNKLPSFLPSFLKEAPEGFRTASDAEKAAQAKAEIDLLSEQLGCLLANSDLRVPRAEQTKKPPTSTDATSKSTSSASERELSQGQKDGGQKEAERMRLKRAALFPHSPEKNAKRHQSYGHD